MRLIIVSLLSIVICISAKAQWTRIHPASPIQRYLHYAYVEPGTHRLLAVGNDIASSDDGGTTWQITAANKLPVHLVPDQKYMDIQFTNKQTGHLAFEGSIYKTSNEGNQWDKKISLLPNNNNYPYSAYFHAIHFTDENNGWAVGEFRKIFRTTNGGNTWTEVSRSAVTAPYIAYTDVQFLNPSVGLISGYEVSNILMNFGFDEFVMKTIDGGQTWKRFSIPTGLDFRKIDLHFTDSNHGYVHLRRTQSNDEIYFTDDGGETWISRTPLQLRTISATRWLSGGKGFAYGNTYKYQYEFIRTTDGGLTWNTVQLPIFDQQDEFAVTDIIFSSGQNGVIVGAAGNILTTTDGGTNWRAANTAYPDLRTFDFVDANVGYASSGKGFFKTDDGGKHWQYRVRSDSLTIYDMNFEETSRGVFFGWRNSYYTIAQNGLDLSPISLPVTFVSISCFKQKGDSLFASGMTHPQRKNFFISSGNNGIDWSVTEIPNATGLITQMERHQNHFYYSDGSGIYRSSTRGTNWTTLATFNNDYLNGIALLDDGTILAALESGKIKRCASSGTWEEVEAFENAAVADFVSRGNQVFAYGKEIRGGIFFGAIWRSIDRGLHWQKESLPVIDNGIRDMDIHDDHVWAIGGFGQVYSFDLTHEVTVTEYIAHDLKPRFYPIPAKEHLDIRTTDEKLLAIELVSAKGKRISVVADELSPFVWRISLRTLTNGIYIVRLRTNQTWYTQKIVKE